MLFAEYLFRPHNTNNRAFAPTSTKHGPLAGTVLRVVMGQTLYLFSGSWTFAGVMDPLNRIQWCTVTCRAGVRTAEEPGGGRTGRLHNL